MKFEHLLFAAAIGMAGAGAFFSIIGVSSLFSGASISTGIMAAIIEFSKIIGITFLYRYWEKTNGLLKIYLGIASLILVLITSCGIFGYLSSAYSKSSIEFKASQDKITMVEGQKTYMVDKMSQSKIRIQTLNDMRRIQEGRLSETITNAFLSRNPIQLKQLMEQTGDMIKSADTDIKTEQDKIQTTTDEILKINQQVNEMKFASTGKKDIRTFQFVADQFGTTLDKVAKWFIFTIIFVFDPLAIALILAYNVVAYKKEDESSNYNNPKKLEIIDSSPIIPAEQPILEKQISADITSSNPKKSEYQSPNITSKEDKLLPRPTWLQ